jgi:hypothetical protein
MGNNYVTVMMEPVVMVYVHRSFQVPVLSDENTFGEANIVKSSYNVMKVTEYFVFLWTYVIISEEYNDMVNSEELIVTSEYLML